MNYSEMTKEQLLNEKSALEKQYEDYKAMNLKLDMSRGKPSTEQLNISSRILDILTSTSDCSTEKGFDCRNYGLMDGITEIKPIFAKMMQVDPDMIMVGGNSSLNMMFDTISLFLTKSAVEGEKPWL